MGLQKGMSVCAAAWTVYWNDGLIWSARLGCGVKWSFRETKVGRRLHFQKHVCGHHWYSGGRTHQGQGCCFRRWSWCIFIDIVYVAYIFLCTKKYPILLFFFDKRVRIGDTKTKNLQCIENQGFEKNFMFLQTTGWVGLGSEIKLWAAHVPALKEDRPGPHKTHVWLTICRGVFSY